MGLQAQCRAWFQGRPSIGKAHLDSATLTFRGDFRVQAPLNRLTSSEARGGQLRLVWSEGEVVLELGAAAEKWLSKIRNPPGLKEKLGWKDGMRVSKVEAGGFELLPEAAEGVAPDSDLILLGAESIQDLQRLPAVARALKPAGAIWIIYPKGRKDFKESDVRAAGRAAGLVDVKTAAFSQTLSALKWVRPKAIRPKGGRP